MLKKVLTVMMVLAMSCVVTRAGYYEPFWEVNNSYEDSDSPSYCYTSLYSTTGSISAYACTSFTESAGEQDPPINCEAWIIVKAGYRWVGGGTPVGGTFSYGYTSSEDSYSYGYAHGNGLVGCGGHGGTCSKIIGLGWCNTEAHGSCQNGATPTSGGYT